MDVIFFSRRYLRLEHLSHIPHSSFSSGIFLPAKHASLRERCLRQGQTNQLLTLFFEDQILIELLQLDVCS